MLDEIYWIIHMLNHITWTLLILSCSKKHCCKSDFLIIFVDDNYRKAKRKKSDRIHISALIQSFAFLDQILTFLMRIARSIITCMNTLVTILFSSSLCSFFHLFFHFFFFFSLFLLVILFSHFFSLFLSFSFYNLQGRKC